MNRILLIQLNVWLLIDSLCSVCEGFYFVEKSAASTACGADKVSLFIFNNLQLLTLEYRNIMGFVTIKIITSAPCLTVKLAVFIITYLLDFIDQLSTLCNGLRAQAVWRCEMM